MGKLEAMRDAISEIRKTARQKESSAHAAKIILDSTCSEALAKLEAERDAELIDLGFKLFKYQQAVHWDVVQSVIGHINQTKRRGDRAPVPSSQVLAPLVANGMSNYQIKVLLWGGNQFGDIRVTEETKNGEPCFCFLDVETGKESWLKESGLNSKLSELRSQQKKLAVTANR